MLELKWNKAKESYNDFCSRIILNFKEYGFTTARDCFKELTGIDMFDNARKGRTYAKNIQKAIESGYADKFAEVELKNEIVGNKVLVIGDLHTPFEHKGYLNFCKQIYKKYNCDKVVFIGDIIDNHVGSFHDTDVDGHSGGKELMLAKKSIAEYHREFPNSLVCLGNHDILPNRKAFSSGVSKHWIKPIGEVLITPTWTYADHFIIDGVKYTHGTGRQSRQRSQQDMISNVQGHFHAQSYIENYVGADGTRRFAMQIGCGINVDEYAFAYGKHFAKPHLNCGVVIDGRLPIIEFME